MRLTAFIRSGVLVGGVATAACGTEPSTSGMVVRDSLGVMIVEHGPDQPPGLQHWTLEPTPVLTVGETEGDDAYLFSRVLYAGMLPENELLVVDVTAREIRIFDSTGTLVRRFGRQGDGPSEFQTMRLAGIDKSGLIGVYDSRHKRLSRFAIDGSLQQEATEPTLPLGPVLGPFADGSILLSGRIGLSPTDLSNVSTGLVRDSLGLTLLAPNGSTTSAGHFSGTEELRIIGDRIAIGLPPFPLRTVMAVADTVFYVSSQETYEIRTYGMDGTLLRVLRRDKAAESVNAAAQTEWIRERDARIARMSGRPRPPEVVEVDEYQTFPDAFPALGELRIDGAGNLWVEDYRPFPNADTLTTWTVFGPSGAMIATAELPNVTITEIGADRVVGVWTDDDDVPNVRVHRLAKGHVANAMGN